MRGLGLLVLTCLVCLASCTPGDTGRLLLDTATAMTAAHISHCLALQTITPYGTAYLYAQAGDLHCLELWQSQRRATAP